MRYGNVQQPAPIPNDGPACWDLVIADGEAESRADEGDAALRKIVLADMRDRDAYGRAKYPAPLQPHNGRDALADFYQEMLDGAVYAKQAIVEGVPMAEFLYGAVLEIVFDVRSMIRARDEARGSG